MKLNRHGQSTPITEEIYLKVRKHLFQENHKLLFDIAYYTGERLGAILQLQVGNIYRSSSKRLVYEEITFTKWTRKDRTTRQVPISPELRLRLRAYQPSEGGWLFPSLVNLGEHLSMRAASRALERALKRSGLEDAGYSTHSFRRGFITDLHNKGIALRVIQSLTGHKSLSVLGRYVEVSQEQRQSAIALR